MSCLVVSARYALCKVILGLRRMLRLDSLTSLDVLDESKRLAHHFREESTRYDWIRRQLPQTPYWREGHLECARLAILFQEHEIAYGSLLSVLQLTPGYDAKNEAHYLLGLVYTARGYFGEGLAALELCTITTAVSEDKLYEAKAAALLALERPEEAIDYLEKIPFQNRTAAVEAALSYARGMWKQA